MIFTCSVNQTAAWVNNTCVNKIITSILWCKKNIYMKTKIFAILLLTTSLFSCTKTNVDTSNNVDLTNGTWRVSYYWDQQDESSNFSAYYFMFLSNGTFMAHDNSGAVTGTWSISGSKLSINFTNPLLSELNNDWLITEKTTTSIKLKEDNPAQDDKLYFTKN